MATEEEYVAPRTTTEKTLADIWCTLLNVARVGVNDNFFELGGHSLLATQVMSRLRSAFGVESRPPRFESPRGAEAFHSTVHDGTRSNSTLE